MGECGVDECVTLSEYAAYGGCYSGLLWCIWGVLLWVSMVQMGCVIGGEYCVDE